MRSYFGQKRFDIPIWAPQPQWLKERSMVHMFAVGQAVMLQSRVLRPSADGDYEIIRLVPAVPEGPQYRIKSKKEGHERMVLENELTPSSKQASAFR